MQAVNPIRTLTVCFSNNKKPHPCMFCCSCFISSLAFIPQPTILTQDNVVTLLKCSVESQKIYPVEVWKLFFNRTSGLDKALEAYSTMVNPIPQFELYTCISVQMFHPAILSCVLGPLQQQRRLHKCSWSSQRSGTKQIQPGRPTECNFNPQLVPE